MALSDLSAATRKTMTIFFLIDTSGSMSGSKIGTVNGSMEEVLPMLEKISQENDDAEIKIAVLDFSSGYRWRFNDQAPVSVNNVVWEELEAGGLTEMGAAFGELNRVLSREVFMKNENGNFAPVLIMLSDGAPTDKWEENLAGLQKNGWYQNAIKIAIDINSGHHRNVLEAFTCNSEAILEADDKTSLKKMIQKVAIKSSMIQSRSVTTLRQDKTAEEDAGDVVKETKSEIEEEAKEDTGNTVMWEGF